MQQKKIIILVIVSIIFCTGLTLLGGLGLGFGVSRAIDGLTFKPAEPATLQQSLREINAHYLFIQIYFDND